MFVLLKKAAVTALVLYLASHLHFKSFIAIWSGIIFGLALYGSLTSTLLRLPGKDPRTGYIPWHRMVIALPYYLAVALLMIASRIIVMVKGYDSVTKLTEGVYVGDYTGSYASDVNWAAVVDVTNELPRLTPAREYLNIPSWDGCPPTLERIHEAVEFVKQCKKPVLIHCAYVLLCSSSCIQ